MTDRRPLLSVEDLRVHFETLEGTVRAVDGVSFSVDRGETVCLVGESGSGKTVTCESVTRLVPSPPADIVEGAVAFDGIDLVDAGRSQLRAVRGDRIAHVFQNPQSALDPVYSVGEQLVESIQFHRQVPDGAARERAVDLLDRVGIPKAASRVDDYPHEFSGGMRQRVVIAMALSGDPDLLVADEPTTALDVTIEAQILDLLADLQRERDMAVLFVTHDLGVVAEIADRVVIMYAGKVMERGSVYDVFEEPAHPYTRALLRCLPGQGRPLEPIGGEPADARAPPSGCRFHPRCPHAVDACRGGDQPPLRAAAEGGDHEVSCVHYGPDGDRTVLESGAGATETTRGEASLDAVGDPAGGERE